MGRTGHQRRGPTPLGPITLLKMMHDEAELTETAISAWLLEVTRRRDMTMPPPVTGPRADAVRSLFSRLAVEFGDYASIVAGASEAAGRNAAQLAQVVASSGEQSRRVRDSATAIGEARDGASTMTDAAEGLARFAVGASDAADAAGEGLAEVLAALESLAGRLGDGRAPLASMQGSTRDVAHFLTILAKLSRQAQLLSVNALIEAAHLADDGARFAIVASEVRKLSVSTRQAATDVSAIVNQLRTATDSVDAAIEGSGTATAGARVEIEKASAALANTQRSIGDFEDSVASIATIAGEQSAALNNVVSAVAEIARHADEVTQASRDAAKLDLHGLIAGAQTGVQAWRLPTDWVDIKAADEFSSWVAAIANGIAPDKTPNDPGAPAVLELIARINADQLGVLQQIVLTADAIAHNGFAWQAIGTSLEALSLELDTVRLSVAQSADGARDAAERATHMRNLIVTMQGQYDEALHSLEDALSRTAGIAQRVDEIDTLAGAMTGAAERADEILGLIDTVSSETDLLSLNAAIEAAHAGERGLGFSVIAEEIRGLALTTHEATRGVSELVADVTATSAQMRQSTRAAAASTSSVTQSAGRVRDAIGELRRSFEGTLKRALDVAETADRQRSILDRVVAGIGASESELDASATNVHAAQRIELATFGSRAHAVAARRSIAPATARIRTLGETLAERIETVFEDALRAGKISVADLQSGEYTEITGSQIARLGRLFDVSRVPAAGFDPPKYATRWDAAVDEAIVPLIDEAFDALAFARPITIAVVDLNAFIYANPRRTIADWTGDPDRDRSGNRIKRFIDDDQSLRVTRWGLGSNVENVGRRATHAQFREAGSLLDRPAGERPWGVYVYARDTHDVFNDMVIALYVRGQRQGTIRLAYDREVL